MTIAEDAYIARMARPSIVDKTYQGTVDMVAGQEFKVETSPAGEELLTITCPTAQTWLVNVRVDVVASSA